MTDLISVNIIIHRVGFIMLRIQTPTEASSDQTERSTPQTCKKSSIMELPAISLPSYPKLYK